MQLGRLITAMVTPFNEDGEIDYLQTRQLIDHLLNHGSEGLVITGTTGESPTLSFNEKVNLYKFVVDYVNGKVPIIAGTGTNNTRESIELTQVADDQGVDGIMLVTPYYNRPTQRGLYEHFKQIADSTDLPVMLYNIPGRSAVNLNIETVIKLSEINNIVALKDATGNIENMIEIIQKTADDFLLYSGDDGLTLPVLSIGGHGVVSVASHIIGDHMQQMIHNYLDGRVSEAGHINQNILPIINALFAQSSPSPVKAALNMAGVDVGGVRLPLVDLTQDEQKLLQKIIHQQLSYV